MVKRYLDIVCAVILILICFIPAIVIALLIVLGSGFPVFFVQKRVGKHHRPFFLYKFRTMRALNGADQGWFDAGGSARITGIGKILRRSKLDELPQLINVLNGSMSFVGPRPEIEKWTQVYPKRWLKVLSVKPGITDNASIAFRNEEEILAKADNAETCYRNQILPKKLDLYEQYVDCHSLLSDFQIILKTIRVVVTK
ncbi:MAG: sugar transferase [Marinilabiliaceae bacterium]|nr:sugar transferase [Marinilabiliaceae bacterium]